MAIPNLLVAKVRRTSVAPGANDARAYELIGGTELRQIGSTIAVSLETPQPVDHTRGCLNRVIQFKGQRYFYHRNTIRRENEGGSGNWGVVQTMVNQNTLGDFFEHSGIYNVQVNGVNTMIALYQNVFNQFCAVRSTDGATWTTVEPINLSGESTVTFGKCIVFRNRLYMFVCATTDQGVLVYDPQIDTGTLITVPGSNGNPAYDFAVHGNNLFLVGTITGSAGAPTRLSVLKGSVFETIHTFTEVDNGASNEQSTPVLFSDGTDLIAIIPGEDQVRNGGTGEGDVAFRIQNPGTASQTVTDITTTLIPTGLISGGEQQGELQHWSAFVNTDSNPLSPEIYLFRYNQLTYTLGYTTCAVYRYTDSSTELTFIGNGLSYEVGVVDAKFGGSCRIAGDNLVYAELEDITEVTGGVQFSYRVYGTGTNKTATLYVSTGETIPTTVATLAGAASGGTSSRSGNTIINVTPDSGATLYTGIWAANTDGYSETDRVHLQLNLV